MSLPVLPDELLLEVVDYLGPDEAVKMCQTNVMIAQHCNEYVWPQLILRDFGRHYQARLPFTPMQQYFLLQAYNQRSNNIHFNPITSFPGGISKLSDEITLTLPQPPLLQGSYFLVYKKQLGLQKSKKYYGNLDKTGFHIDRRWHQRKSSHLVALSEFLPIFGFDVTEVATMTEDEQLDLLTDLFSWVLFDV